MKLDFCDLLLSKLMLAPKVITFLLNCIYLSGLINNSRIFLEINHYLTTLYLHYFSRFENGRNFSSLLSPLSFCMMCSQICMFFLNLEYIALYFIWARGRSSFKVAEFSFTQFIAYLGFNSLFYFFIFFISQFKWEK